MISSTNLNITTYISKSYTTLANQLGLKKEFADMKSRMDSGNRMEILCDLLDYNGIKYIVTGKLKKKKD